MYKSVFLLILLVGLSVLGNGCDSSVEAQSVNAQAIDAQRERVFTQLTSGIRTFASSLTEIEGRAFFVAEDPATGKEPWITDGTIEGTMLLKDIWPGPADSRMGTVTDPLFALFEGWVYFFADDGVNGKELWRTDGTEEGTELFMEFIPGPEGVFGAIHVSGTHNNDRDIDTSQGDANKMYLWVGGVTGQNIWVFE